MHGKIVFVNGFGIFAGHRRPGKVLEFCDQGCVTLELLNPHFLEEDCETLPTFQMTFSLETGRATTGCGEHAIAGSYGWNLWRGDLVELQNYFLS